MTDTLPRATARDVNTPARGLDKSNDLRIVEQDKIPVLVGVAKNVASWRVACEAAMAAPGVLVIADETVLVGARLAQRPEQAVQVASAVRDALRLRTADSSVIVACDGSVVTLSGRATGSLDKSAAGVAAWSVPGVGSVQNWIRAGA